MGGRGVGAVAVAPDQVAPVGWPEGPGQLELAEAKQRGDARRLARGACRRRLTAAPYCVPVLIAYWLGAIGTIGSLSWLRWLISCVHWLAWRMFEAAAEACLLVP